MWSLMCLLLKVPISKITFVVIVLVIWDSHGDYNQPNDREWENLSGDNCNNSSASSSATITGNVSP